MIKKSTKICFVSSSGGHLEQILMLKPLMEKYDSFLITEKTSYKVNVEIKKLYYLIQINRKEKGWFLKFLFTIILSLIIFFKEKPDVVISTGVLSTVPMCIIAKIFRKKLIYIESFAKISTPTLSGRLLYKYADRFYVQWESMLKIYPKAIYLGGIY